MILTGHGGVYSLHQLTEQEIEVIFKIVVIVDKNCFHQRDPNGNWYGNGDFYLKLTDEERTALAKLGEGIGLLCSK